MAIQVRSIELTSDSSGDVTATLEVNGRVAQIVINPDGTDVPTASWDLTITDTSNVQVFQNVTLSAVADTVDNPVIVKTNSDFMFPVAGTLTLVGANMGNAKKALVSVYVEQN